MEVADLLTADEVFLTGTAGVPAAGLDQWRRPAERPVFDAVAYAFRAVVSSCSERTWPVS